MYDLLIMLPLGIERLITGSIKSKQRIGDSDDGVEYLMEEKS